MDEIVIYPVTDDELANLGRGGPASVMFSLAMLLVGAGVGCLGSLLAGGIPENIGVGFVVLTVITVVSLLGGGVLLCIWWRLPNETRQIIDRIRKRAAPPEGERLDNGGREGDPGA